METRVEQKLITKPPRAITLPLSALLLLALCLGPQACSHKIGDSCSSGADCDPTSGTRTCDLSQPGGYCLLEGCDARSCPSDSICVRFFPELLLMQMSTPAGMNACAPVPEGAVSSCRADELCLPTCVASDEPCLTGVCARLSWEKRDCVQSCGSDGDCRGGYVCRKTGTAGTIALTTTANATPSFCAPAPAP